jgi:glycogen operon protein
MDLVSHTVKHNEANGEDNRDGHNENHSWNNGAEGETTDGAVLSARRADVKALLASLFLSRGTVMLTAGDEGGRSQNGNNNAYCQDNAITWVHWDRLDDGLMLAILKTPDLQQQRIVHLAIAINRTHGEQALALPPPEGRDWTNLLFTNHPATSLIHPRSVEIFVEKH